MFPGYEPSSADLTLLSGVIASVARRGRLSPEDAADFSQSVHLRFLEQSYEPLARFAGRSSLRTYLTVVVHRLLLDWRNARYGKWRPSAAAARLGPIAIALERLVTRDGHTADEAAAILANRPGAPDDRTLQEVVATLPFRARPRVVPLDEAPDAGTAAFVDPVEAAQEADRQRERERLLRGAVARLSAVDRQILELRFERGLTVSAIATHVNVSAKVLYRRLARLVTSLRRGVLEPEARNEPA